MAKRKTKKQREAEERYAVLRQIVLAVAVGVWVIVLAALISYDPADAPSYAVGVANPDTANWMGPLGAAVAHKAYFLLGPGTWILTLGLGAWLVLTLSKRVVDQVVLRAVGLLIMTATTSGLMAVTTTAFVKGYDGRPEGPGGLLGVFLHEELVGRFATGGSLLILGIAFWIGALLAVDQIVLAIPKLLAEGVMRITNVGRERWPGLRGGLPEINLPKWRMPKFAWAGLGGEVEQRQTDLDGEPIRLPAKSKKKRKAKRHGRDEEASEGIDENAGGLGGSELLEPVEDDDYEYEYEDEGEESADEEDLSADAPSAYVNSKKKFDP
ncbi:MAG: DNA translocase FtsK 4TM domain-containing protein, partial [Planctomycetota bacterium]